MTALEAVGGLVDHGTERMLVAALLNRPELLDRVPELAVADLADYHAIAVLSSIRNIKHAGGRIDLVSVRAHLAALILERDPKPLNEHPDYGSLSWYDQLVALPVRPDPPVEAWAASVVRMAARRAAAVAGAEPVEDPDVDDFAIRDVEPPPPTTGSGPAVVGIHSKRDFARNDKTGAVLHTQDNIALALLKLGVSVRRDIFGGHDVVEGLEDLGPRLTDQEINRIRLLIDSKYTFRLAKEFFLDVIKDTALRNRFHPIIDHFRSLPPRDGVPRVGHWLVRYAGAADTPYVRAVGQMWLVAAVRRVRQPGCVFQELLILEGEPGVDKSTALTVLAGNRDWFSDNYPIGGETRKLMEQTMGRWIVESPELKGMNRSDINALKAQLSQTHDEARLAYGYGVTKVARQYVPIGTCNRDGEYLRDPTGNRRFLPVRIAKFDLSLLRAERDQLWAEACALEASGASIRLDPTLYSAAAAEQEDRYIVDPMEYSVRAAFGEVCGKVPVTDAMSVLGIVGRPLTLDEMSRFSSAMMKCGWCRSRLRGINGDREYFYVRGNDEERRVLLQVIGRGSDSLVRPRS